MNGTKRFGASESNSEINDSFSQSKRILVESQFDIQRADIQRAGPSQQQPMDAPSLDMRRAELSRQHVRALNTQFASWIQIQFQNHPDELWEDGAEDYLHHASNIMNKFSDVVNWLKANSATEENLSTLESGTAPKKLLSDSNKNPVSGIPPSSATTGFALSWGNPIRNNVVSEGKDNNEIKTFPEKHVFGASGTTAVFPTSWGNPVQNKLFPETKDKDTTETGITPATVSSAFGMTWPTNVPPVPIKLASEDNNTNGIKAFSEKPGITPAGSTTGFGMSWNSAPVFGSQTPFSFGNQNSVPVNNNVSNDTEGGDDDVEQPSSPSVKKSEEKGVTVVHEMKCKLYVKSSDPADKDAWKDKGTGQLSIKCKEGFSKGSKESKPTIVVRNDVGRILLNALLYPGIKTNIQKNSIVAIFHTSEDDKNDSVVARTFLIRAKTEDDRNKLASAIQEYAPAV